jgi:hypothetical protein
VWDPFFVGQELIDARAVSMEQVLTLPDSNHDGIEFIRTEAKEETGKADENEQPLPESALR